MLAETLGGIHARAREEAVCACHAGKFLARNRLAVCVLAPTKHHITAVNRSQNVREPAFSDTMACCDIVFSMKIIGFMESQRNSASTIRKKVENS